MRTFGKNGATEIILIGGGTAQFTDRPSILEADFPYTPIYREIATFTIPSKYLLKNLELGEM